MRKFVLTVFTVFFLCFGLLSQTSTSDKKKVSAGIVSGINISRLILDGKDAGLMESDFRTGFVFGTFVNFPIKKSPFSIQPQFLYSSMGGDLKTTTNETQNVRLNYFSLPVLIKYNFSKRLAAFAGPQIDAIIYGKETNKYGEIDITQSVEDFDAYVTWGMEWWLSKNFFFNGRFMHGARQVYPVAPDITANNRGFQLTIGFKFHKPKPWSEPQPVVVLPPVDKDSDGDGVLDSRDKCPTVAGVAKYEGCPVPDTDKDGVYDDKDKCPESPGYPELDGCPYPDRDKDGVTDNKDRCPDQPGSTKNDGCPANDRDGDSVPDATDRCPDAVGPASNNGCPDDSKKLEFIAKNIYFYTDKATLQERSYEPLDQLVTILKNHPNAKLSIEGHTDNSGSSAYNKKLSENRAKSVVTYLTDKGIDAGRLNAVGFGEDKPVTSNSNAEGRAFNRRVELKIVE